MLEIQGDIKNCIFLDLNANKDWRGNHCFYAGEKIYLLLTQVQNLQFASSLQAQLQSSRDVPFVYFKFGP